MTAREGAVNLRFPGIAVESPGESSPRPSTRSYYRHTTSRRRKCLFPENAPARPPILRLTSLCKLGTDVYELRPADRHQELAPQFETSRAPAKNRARGFGLPLRLPATSRPSKALSEPSFRKARESARAPASCARCCAVYEAQRHPHSRRISSAASSIRGGTQGPAQGRRRAQRSPSSARKRRVIAQRRAESGSACRAADRSRRHVRSPIRSRRISRARAVRRIHHFS